MADKKNNPVPEDGEEDENYDPDLKTPEDDLDNIEDALLAEEIISGCCDDQEEDR